MTHACIEYELVDIPAIPLFAALSWLMAPLIYLRRGCDLLLQRLLSGDVILPRTTS